MEPLLYVRHDNALENKALIKVANDLQWKLGVTKIGKGTPQRNQLVELGCVKISVLTT